MKERCSGGSSGLFTQQGSQGGGAQSDSRVSEEQAAGKGVQIYHLGASDSFVQVQQGVGDGGIRRQFRGCQVVIRF